MSKRKGADAPRGQSADAPPSRRRPTDDDLEPLMALISEGQSLTASCRRLQVDPPSAHRWLHEDDGRRQRYARALEMRADHFQEQALSIGRAAALGLTFQTDPSEPARKIDANGARVYLDAIKWATARMAPKTAPVQRVSHSFEEMTDEELERAIAEKLRGPDGPSQA